MHKMRQTVKQQIVRIQQTEIRSFAGSTLPALFSPDPGTAKRVFEFFAANIRNPNTRKAYAKATGEFAAWCEARGLAHLRDVQPVHVAAYIEELQQRIAAPSVKLQLAAIRMLFDWLVLGQIVPANPASVVRGPKHSIKKGKTPVLSADEARTLLDSIDIDHGSTERPRPDRPAHVYFRPRRRGCPDARRRRVCAGTPHLDPTP